MSELPYLLYNTEVFVVAFSLDVTHILTASEDRTAILWDTQGNILGELKEHQAPIISANFSPDGKQIITTSGDGTVFLWPTPETILEYLKTARIPKLTPEEKKELGIENFKID